MILEFLVNMEIFQIWTEYWEIQFMYWSRNDDYKKYKRRKV